MKFERLLETYLAYAPVGFKSFATALPIWLKDKLFQKSSKVYMEYKKVFNGDITVSIADLQTGVPFPCHVRSVAVTGGTVYILA